MSNQHLVVFKLQRMPLFHCLLCFVIVSAGRLTAQISAYSSSHYDKNKQLVLQQPNIPSPENKLLFVLQEQPIEIRDFNGHIVSVTRKETRYHPAGNMVYKDSLLTQVISTNKSPLQQLPYNTIIDKIGVDSMVTVNDNTFKLYTLDEDTNEARSVYTLKNDLITHFAYNGAVKYELFNYSYDTNDILISEVVTDDYGVTKVNTFHNEFEQTGVLSKYEFKSFEGMLMKETRYQFTKGTNNQNLLTQLQTEEKHYNLTLTEYILDHIIHLRTDQLHKNSPIRFSSYNFTYNQKNQLIKAVKQVRVLDIANHKESLYNRTFVIEHQAHKMLVNASALEKEERVWLQKEDTHKPRQIKKTHVGQKEQYEYIFDNHHNPIQITTYTSNDNKRRLERQINYHIYYKD